MVPRHHHRGQKVVLAGAQHPLFNHRAGGDDAGYFSLYQALGLGGIFYLVADGDGVTLFHQQRAVAIQRMVGNPRQGHLANCLTSILTG